MNFRMLAQPAIRVFGECDRLFLGQDSKVAQSESRLNGTLYLLGRFARADLLGFAPAVVADEDPPTAVSFSDLHTHFALPINSFTIASTSIAETRSSR